MDSRVTEVVDVGQISRREFSTSFRGYDQIEVRAYLGKVGRAFEEALARLADLEGRLATAEERARRADHIDDKRLTALLGEETVRVLDAAREAAAEIRTKSEESASRLIREAQDEAARLREDANELLERRSAEAERAAELIRNEAEARRAQARKLAEAEVEAGRQKGREMVAEAQAVRERVLKDLARRRRLARSQLDQLRASRQRLLDAYGVVRRTIDQATSELAGALPEARLAAEQEALQGLEADLAKDVTGEVPTLRIDDLEPEPEVDAHDESAPRASSSPALRPVPAPVVPLTVVPSQPPVPSEPEVAEEADVDGAAHASADRRAQALRLSMRRPRSVPAPALLDETGPEPVATEPEPPADSTHSADTADTDVTEPELVVSLVDGPDPVEEVDARSPVEGDAVDALFAQLRASRREHVARAEAVLAPAAEPGADVAAGVAAGEASSIAVDVAPEPDSPFAARDAALVPIAASVARRLKRVLSDDQNEVLDAVRRSPKSDLDSLLPRAGQHAARYAAAMQEGLGEAATAGRDAAGGAGSVPAVEPIATVAASELIQPLRARLERAMSEAAGDVDVALDHVRSCFREWRDQRVVATADATARDAYALGLYAGLPDGASVRWCVDPDHPSADCEDNALGGALTKGREFPTGHLHPPAHPGCRCLVLADDQ